MASLWTGLHPARAGVTRFDEVLVPEAKLPAEIFREAGFRTAGIWRNGWVEGYFGFDQGFEVYTRPGQKPVPEQLRRENPTIELRRHRLRPDRRHQRVPARARARAVVPVPAPDGRPRVHLRRRERAVRHVALRHLRQLRSCTSTACSTSCSAGSLEQGQLQKTLIVIASDHGEAFGERGNEGHARNVYPEAVEVPLLIGFPFRLAQPGGDPAAHRQRRHLADRARPAGSPCARARRWTLARSRDPRRGERRRCGAGDDGQAIAHLDRTWGQRVETSAPNVAVSEGPYRYLCSATPKGEIEREELFDLRRRSAARWRTG